MTPKEKARELVDKYRDTIMSFLSDNMKDMNAKQCALIAVDEIINAETYIWGGYNRDEYRNYFQEVKQEIEKI